jgi:hypothetical protein
MPEPPPGEADLRTLARRYERAENQIRELVARAPAGDRRPLLLTALEILIVLRTLDSRGPIVRAYLAENGPFGDTGAVTDLAGKLAKRLDDGVRRAQAGSRRAFRFVTTDNLDEMTEEAVTAHEQPDGTRWSLGRWSTMQTSTLGRQATSRGLANSMGEGGQFVVQGPRCKLCQTLFEGVLEVGKDRMPPAHPHCDCLALRL